MSHYHGWTSVSTTALSRRGLRRTASSDLIRRCAARRRLARNPCFIFSRLHLCSATTAAGDQPPLLTTCYSPGATLCSACALKGTPSQGGRLCPEHPWS